MAIQLNELLLFPRTARDHPDGGVTTVEVVPPPPTIAIAKFPLVVVDDQDIAAALPPLPLPLFSCTRLIPICHQNKPRGFTWLIYVFQRQ